MNTKYQIPHFERLAAIVCSLIGLYSVTLVAVQLLQYGLQSPYSFVLKTPIFYIGFLCWIFWLSRTLKLGGYKYAFVGWWLCAAWHSLLVLAAVISIIGFALIGLAPISSTLIVIAAATSVSVVMYFMMDREEKQTS